MNFETIAKAGGSAFIGLVIGWGVNAVAMGGRVDAIEKTLVRIEARLYGQAPTTVQINPPPVAAKP